MNILEFLKFLPKPAIFLLSITLIFLAFAIFSFLKSRAKKEGIQPESPSLTPAETLSSPKKTIPENLLLILTILLLLLSMPLAVLLVGQRQEISNRAKEQEERFQEPTPYKEQVSPPSPFCGRIKIYDEEWAEIPYESLSHLSFEEIIRIAVQSEKEGEYDKGRIRINSMEWKPENEIASQKPDSPGEFYLECKVEVADGRTTICGIGATPEDEFKIEAEVHDAIADEWH